MTSVN